MLPLCTRVFDVVVGKSRINQHAVQLMQDAASRLDPPHALLPRLRNALSICISYSNGMEPSQFDKDVGAEAGLALRLLHRTFAEHTAVSFTRWVAGFDVCPRTLTLDVALTVLRAAHQSVVPSGEMAILYIGIDSFSKLVKGTFRLLDDVVAAIGKAMSNPPPDSFVIGMLSGSASGAMKEALDNASRWPITLHARLLSLAEAEEIVDKMPPNIFPSASWRTCKPFRRSLAGRFSGVPYRRPASPV